ncbi:MAG: delta-aminolevulinic acid dehydratase [Parahaliea sp.]
MFRKLITIALLSSMFSPGASTASAGCNCLWRGSFADVQAGADLVISGTVTATAGNSIDFYIDQKLRGKQPLDEVRIWLKTGNYCRPEVETFPIDSQWVMALHEIKEDVPGGFSPHTPNISYGRIGDYQLSNCGGYWLSREGDWVSGNLINAPRWVREPKMSPVLLEVIRAYVRGEIDREVLLQAGQEDPNLKNLMLDTKAFLRDEH